MTCTCAVCLLNLFSCLSPQSVAQVTQFCSRGAMTSVRRRLAHKQPRPTAWQDAAVEAGVDNTHQRPDPGVGDLATSGQDRCRKRIQAQWTALKKARAACRARRRAQKIALNKARKAVKLPKKRKPFALFCQSWLAGRSLPRGQRFKGAAQAWRNASPRERKKWMQQAKDEALDWKAAAMQQGLLYVSSGLGKSKKDHSSIPGGLRAARPPNSGMSMTCGPYTWQLADKCELGRGSYGTVYLGSHCHTLSPVAVKVYVDGTSARKEIEFLKDAAKYGPHAPFPKVFATEENERVQAIVMEAFGQDLRGWLHDNIPGVYFQHSSICQLGCALAHLHNVAKIVHLDVKAANILIHVAQFRTVLCDFSSAEEIREKKPSNSMHCTLNYRPLEFFVDSVVPSCLLAPAADLWSFGCVVWELAARGFVQKPFQHLFQGGSKSGVRNQCQHYVNVVHGARCLPQAYWIGRLAEAGPDWQRTVKSLCHPKPSCRRLPAVEVQTAWPLTASIFQG